jgi:ribosomal protein L22
MYHAYKLTLTAVAALHPRSTRWTPSIAQRHVSNSTKPTKDTSAKDTQGIEIPENPLLEKVLKQREEEKGITPADKKDKKSKPPLPVMREGTMSRAPTSLFLPEREIPGWSPSLPPAEQKRLKAQAAARRAAVEAENERKLLDMSLDPSRPARERLERRLVIASLKKGGRLTKAQNLARTERQSVYKSHSLPTSVKKLQKVVNQIAGKSVSEALVQLRFSKKRVARDVIKGLQIAQNEAIAGRGMGLGSGLLAQKRWEAQRSMTDGGKVRDIKISKAEREGHRIRPVTVEMKDGSKKVVRDPSEIYIDQAWVGKGESWKSPEYRARGQMNLLTHRTTSKFAA